MCVVGSLWVDVCSWVTAGGCVLLGHCGWMCVIGSLWVDVCSWVTEGGCVYLGHCGWMCVWLAVDVSRSCAVTNLCCAVWPIEGIYLLVWMEPV